MLCDLGSSSQTIQVVQRPQVDSSSANGRGGEPAVAQVVPGQQFKVASGIEDVRHAGFVNDVDVPARQNGRGAEVAVQLRLPDHLARGGIETGGLASVLHHVQKPVG